MVERTATATIGEVQIKQEPGLDGRIICCVPGCTTSQLDSGSRWTAQFPHNELLLSRWKAAIYAGTGAKVPTTEGGAVVCSVHFLPAPTGMVDNVPNRYTEPVLFVRENIQLQVESCGLCLQYEDVEDMYSANKCLTSGHSLQSLAKKYFGHSPSKWQRKQDERFCEQCTVRIDLVHAFGQEVADKAKKQLELCRTMAREKLSFADVWQQSPTAGDYGDFGKVEDAITIKIEPGLEQGDTVITDQNGNGLNRVKLRDGENDGSLGANDIIVKEEPKLAEPNLDEGMETAQPQRFSKPPQLARFVNPKCFICNIKFNGKDSLIHHLMVGHRVEDEYRCATCDISFCKIQTYNSHMSIHDPEKAHECSVCKTRFARKSGLQYHESVHHGIGKKVKRASRRRRCTCAICGKTYCDLNELQRHEKVKHLGEAVTRCNICDRTFAALRNLETHMLIHRDERPYKCQHCDFAFRHRSIMVKHMRRKHNADGTAAKKQRNTSNSKQLVVCRGGIAKSNRTCNLCLATFKQTDEIVAHFKTVHPERDLKLYPCKLCDQVFFMATTLNSHQYIHSDRFACPDCGKRHYSNPGLAKHRLTVHGVPLEQTTGKKGSS